MAGEVKRWITPSGNYYKFHEDLLKQKHILIAGATGSGKSVLVNGLIYTMLYNPPGIGSGRNNDLILIDPKRVELYKYKDLPHTLAYASEPNEFVNVLRLSIMLIDKRFSEMRDQGITQYQSGHVYIIIDEFADLMTTQGKVVAPLIQRIAQIGRAANVHLVLCTQCPLAKIIPTEIKVNFDCIIGLHTATARDSRNIINQTGCELLPPFGSGYIIEPGQAPRIIQTIPKIDDQEIQRLIAHWMAQDGSKKQFQKVKKIYDNTPEDQKPYIYVTLPHKKGLFSRLFRK